MRRLLGPTAVVVILAGWVGCWRWLAPERRGLRPDVDLVTLITALAAWLLLGALGWLVLLVVLATAEPYVGRSCPAGLTSYVGCPAWLRGVLLTLCGAATVGVLGAPALAHDDGGATAAVVGTSGIADGLPLPDRVLDPPTAPPSRGRASVVVEAGDSLWSITRHRLGPAASAARVDAGWRRLYDRNRARIGDDPDLIAPGTRLLLPTEGRRP